MIQFMATKITPCWINYQPFKYRYKYSYDTVLAIITMELFKPENAALRPPRRPHTAALVVLRYAFPAYFGDTK